MAARRTAKTSSGAARGKAAAKVASGASIQAHGEVVGYAEDLLAADGLSEALIEKLKPKELDRGSPGFRNTGRTESLSKAGRQAIAAELGEKYQRSMSPGRRRSNGRYYTPAKVAALMLALLEFDESIAASKEELPKIYEPAMGCGAFLSAAAARLQSKSCGDAISILRALNGEDTDPAAVFIARAALLLQLGPFADPAAAVKTVCEKIEAGDSLSHIGKARADVDVCLANPPYLGEDEHRGLFARTLRRFPSLKRYALGKMDYFYFFLHLGIERLREGGRFAFITTSYYPTADGARKLRRHILSECRLRLLAEVGRQQLFEGAPGQHNMIAVLEKRADRKLRENHRPAISMPNGAAGIESGALKTIAGPMSQREMAADGPEARWSLFRSPEQHGILEKMRRLPLRLGGAKAIATINQGVVPNPIRITEKTARFLAGHGVKARVGEGVFVLSEEELSALELSKHERSVAQPLIKGSGIERYRANRRTGHFLLYMHGGLDVSRLPAIMRRLGKFKLLLQERREVVKGSIPWWALHWPRKPELFLPEAVAAPYRASPPRFAYIDNPLYTLTDVYFIHLKEDGAWDYKSLCAYLNSRPVIFFLALATKRKGRLVELLTGSMGEIRLPSPDAAARRKLAEIADRGRMQGGAMNAALQDELDGVVAELIGLKPQEMDEIRRSLAEGGQEPIG